MICPLCLSQEHQEFDRDKNRSYQLCSNCTLVYVPREQLISSAEEKQRYDSHENSTDDPGYAAYLNNIADSMLPYLASGMKGLDFGCGRTTLLADLLEESHLTMNSYDLYFHPNEKVWEGRYDFIVLSEVIEHLSHPREIMKKLCSLLNEEGMIFIKTKFYPKDASIFKNWFYKRDKTHVQFFNEESFQFLVKEIELSSFERIGDDLYLLKK